MKSEYKILEQEHHWTSEEKLKFCGYGEWIEEADMTEIEYLGYNACVARVFTKEPFVKDEAYFGGHFCGYVNIPNDHPYFRKKDINLECHGGLTLNESHEKHWIGFDCAHSGDLVPTMERWKSICLEMEHQRTTLPELIELRKQFLIPEGSENHYLFNPVYRNLEYCIEECISIINQLIDVAETAYIKESDGEIQ